jgi:uroporphyrinogen III methyltransferase/synthase
LRERLAWYEGRRILLLATKDERPVVGAAVTTIPPLRVSWRGDVLDAVVDRLGRFAWIAFTSAYAVQALTGALARRGLDARALGGKKLAAVGKSTARALCSLANPDCVGRAGGAALADELLAAGPPGPTLVLRAAGGRAELGERLRAAGVDVEVVDAYDMVPNQEGLARAVATHRERPFAGLAFTSPRGMRAFFDAGGAPGTARLGAVGETTRAALVQRGLTVDVMPARPSVQELVDELGALLARGAKIE